MDIIVNTKERKHINHLNELIVNSEVIFIIVAFLKKSGLDLIYQDLEIHLKKGKKLTIVCGLDFYQTEPRALKVLNRLFNIYPNGELYIYDIENKINFHPKLYLFKNDNNYDLIVGSANFTKGGFSDNIEISVKEKFNSENEILKILNLYINDIIKLSKKADDIEISTYTRKYEIHKRNIKDATKKTENEINELYNFDINKLKIYLESYKSDKKEIENYHERENNYIEAKKILDKITDTNITKDGFINYYEMLLVGGEESKKLWHSDKLYRHKSDNTFNDYGKFKEMIRIIRQNLEKKPKEILQILSIFYKGNNKSKISGVGINIVTEILNTYKPEKFAVVNKNPITSLKELGFEIFPNAQGFKPEDYEDYCNVLTNIMTIADLKSLGQVDHFLNHIYQILKKRK